MKPSNLLILMFAPFSALAQFAGTYNASLNGDNVTLTLEQNGKAITGLMKDSGQTYQIQGTAVNNRLDGKAVDQTYGITFFITAFPQDDVLEMDFDLDLGGYRQDAFNLQFNRTQKDELKNLSANARNKKPVSLAKKSIDPAIIGTWKHESFYSSGYGADAMSGSSVSYMSFNADGTMSDQGGNASISGSYYSGKSGQDGRTENITNIWYYTENSRIYIFSYQNGKEEAIELGKYYVENGNLLITASNGNKTLLRRVQ